MNYRYWIVIFLWLYAPVSSHKHIYVSKKHHPKHLVSKDTKIQYHGVDKDNNLLFSLPYAIESKKSHGNSTRSKLKRHSNKIIDVIQNDLVIATTHKPDEVYSDLKPWLPLSHNATIFEHGLVIRSSAKLPWYIVNMVEGHESVLSLSSYRSDAFKPTMVHGAKVLVSEYKHHALANSNFIDYAWEGDIVTVTDSGLDYTHCAFKTPEVHKYIYNGLNHRQIETDINHQSTKDKVVAYVRLGIPLLAETDFEDPVEDGGHGTHVSGIVAGDECLGRTNKMGVLVVDLMKRGQEFLQLPPFFTDILTISYNIGSRVMTNSWGDLNGGRTYTQLARDMDEFLMAHDDYMIFQASGNDGRLGVHDPGTFKNGVTVGASLNSYASWLAAFPHSIGVGTRADIYNEDNLFEFSSRGGLGGRQKPDLVGPGGLLMSSRPGGGMVGKFGTSMATPLVAWRYMMVRAQLPKDVSALVPYGIMVAESDLMEGWVVDYSSVGAFKREKVGRADQGWGLARGRANPAKWKWFDRVEMTEGVKEWCFKAPHKGREHRVVLLWRDVPSWPGGDGRLVVDYDLRVVLNRKKGAVEVLMADDHRNNAEKAVWRGGKDQQVRVQVWMNSVPKEYHHPLKFTLVYSPGLKLEECPKECQEEESPGWRCPDGGIRVCQQGQWSEECFRTERTGEYNLTEGGSRCHMSTVGFRCRDGVEEPWPPKEQRRLLEENQWGLMEMMAGGQEMVTFETFQWTMAVVVGVPLVLVAVKGVLFRG